MGDIGRLWPWLAFGALVLLLLTLDLVVLHRKVRTPSLAESLGWTLFWVALAAAFNLLVWRTRGGEAGLAFLTGYVVEWSLSMDNVFMFAVIFRFFEVPLRFQYRVLFWGILGAIAIRLALVLTGAGLLHRFPWFNVVFGLFLAYTAVRLLGQDSSRIDPQRNHLLRIARRLLPLSRQSHDGRFFAHEDGRWCVTPLLLVLLVIESTDVLFAVDSVPAIFGITRDTFVVFTSNIFAILGLRALYFLLAGMLDRFRYLNYGLSAVLAFIGGKMLAEYCWAGRLPSWLSLLIVVSLLGIAVVASMLGQARNGR